MLLYAQIILPLSFRGQTFTYSAEPNLQLEVGMRVEVTLRGKIIVGIVASIDNTPPSYAVKSIIRTIESTPLFTPRQITAMRWVSEYYMCNLGNLFRLSIPKIIRSGDYQPPTRLAYKLDQSQVIRNSEILKKRKAAAKALELLSSMGAQHHAVSLATLTAEGVSAAGLKTLFETGIAIKSNVPLRNYLTHSITEPTLDNNTLSIVNATRPMLVIGLQLKKQLPQIELIAQHTAAQSKQLLIITPSSITAGQIALQIDQNSLLQESVIEYHTGTSPSKKAENYLRLLNHSNTITTIVGTYHALMLPIENLGHIIVIDESNFAHKSTRDPRINARDVALYISHLYNVPITLTTQAPSMESYNALKIGAYGIVDYTAKLKAEVRIVAKGKSNMISQYFVNQAEQTIAEGNQVVIFQNRRGYASYISCEKCGYTPSCTRCSTTLALHQSSQTLKCHQCNYAIKATALCPKCKSGAVVAQGMGTERVEEIIKELFPLKSITRIDSDNIGSFEKNAIIESDVIIGTSLIFSGIEIPRVKLTAVINADNMFLSTDFRTSERAMQTLQKLQIMATGEGELIIQTSTTDNPLLKAFENGDIISLYDKELLERKELSYPPFTRLCTIHLQHKDRKTLFHAALELDQKMQSNLRNIASPPFEPIIEKINDLFTLDFNIKIPRNQELAKLKHILQNNMDEFTKRFPYIKIIADIDPS